MIDDRRTSASRIWDSLVVFQATDVYSEQQTVDRTRDICIAVFRFWFYHND